MRFLSGTDSPRSAWASAVAVVLAISLICLAGWLRTPGAAAFNDEAFGRFYTAGAILMIGFYLLIYFGLVGGCLIAAVFAWIRRESPLWLRWVGTVMSIAGPIIATALITRK